MGQFRKFLVGSIVVASLVPINLCFGDDAPPTVEYSPPKGNITINCGNKDIVITIKNKKKSGSITIVKIDADTKLPIQGVKFVLKDKATGKIVAEGITDVNGRIVFDNLPLGQYYYEEVSAPDPY